MDALVTNLTTGITGFVNDCLSAIGSIVPAALPIMGAGLLVTVAIKFTKKAAQ